MARRNTVEIIINAEDRASRTISGVGESIQGVGRVALAGIGIATAAVTAFGVSSVAAFSTFERSLNEVFTLLPGISGEAMEAMSSQVQQFSTRFGTLTDEVVPALYQALSAGVPPDNVFEFLETAQMAAIGGVTDLETAVDGISSVVNAYGAEVLSAAQASDIMFTAVRLGKCVVGETRVLLADGQYKRIDELQEGAKVVAYDGRNFVPMNAKWVDQGVKPTVKLTTRLGREIVTTWNHPYLSIPKKQDDRSTRAPQWCKVSELKVGDRIAVPTSLPYFGEKSIPEHKAGLLGLWLAEGNSNSTLPRITTTEYGEQVEEWASEWGLTIKNYEKRSDKSPQYGLSNGYTEQNPFQEWLK